MTRRAVLAGLAGAGGAAVATREAGAKATTGLPVVTILSNAYLAGMAYYDFADGPRGIRRGDPLVLRRQPDNPHDALAVEVLVPDGRKLGYVARVENEALARLMDAGVPVRASVASVGDDIYSVSMRIEALLPLAGQAV